MSLAEQLDYRFGRPNPIQRAIQAFGATRPGAWFFSKTLAPMDRAVSKLSHGRTTVPAIFAGLPVLLLTSSGRRSGQPRHHHLIAVPYADSLALLGTNYGQPRTPAWVHNLEANPDAAVSYGGVTREVRARPATESERDAVLARSRSVYGGYVKYQQRITGRRLRIFILEPRSPEPTS